MKKIIAILLLAAAGTVSAWLTSCASRTTAHTHVFSDEWTYDEVYHWHAAECAHMAETEGKAEHVFDQGIRTEATFESEGFVTYTCTVCGYQKTTVTDPVKEHAFSDVLTHDGGDTHWYACLDEGYEDLKKGEETHALVETDYDESTGYATYTCVCGYSGRFLRSTVLVLPEVTTEVFVGQKLSNLPLSGGQGSVEGSFVWSEPETVVTASGNYNVTFLPYDPEYAPATQTISLTAVQLTVTVTAGEYGSASPSGEIAVNYGENLTVAFIPDNGYKVGTLIVDGEEVAAARSFSFEKLTANHTVDVTFTEMTEEDLTFTLTFVSGTENAWYFDGEVLTFTEIDSKTTYAISGELEGSILIDVGDDYKFDLELTGFTLSCDTVNPITVLSGDEVSLTAKKGTSNFVYDTREGIDDTDETLFSAAIYSLTDLEICGKGSLTVESSNNDGIHTKDDLQVKNLTLSVTCVDNALKGNDGVEITDATTTLVAKQGDCIKTTNSHINENTLNQKGTVSVSGGTHNLYAACDGIDSAYDVLIDDETTVLNVYTDRYSSYSEEITAISEGIYYLRYTSTAYKFSVRYSNGDDDCLWVNASDDYQTVSSSSGRPGGSNTRYYYYTFPKKTGYTKLAVYMYSSAQTQGQAVDYYARSEEKSTNSSYDTIALTYLSGSLSVSWTNYATTTTRPGGGMGGMQEGNTDKGDHSTKGIKAANEIKIEGGTIFVQAYDDAFHAGDGDMIDGGITLDNGSLPTGNLTVNGGSVTAFSHDDGLHAEGTLFVNGGNVSVTGSYEGLEGTCVAIRGGSVSVRSSDDGVNATAASGTGIEISGGTVYVYATGDGLDANSKTSYGGILFSGGRTVVVCNSNGNSAIDTEQGYTHTGGTVVAVMTSGGMTSESSNGKTAGMTTKSSLSLTSGSYLTAAVNSATTVSVRMPCSMTAYVVYLGSSGATISSSSSVSGTPDADGVVWAV